MAIFSRFFHFRIPHLTLERVLSEHLSQVHQSTSEERKPLLKVAVFSHQVTPYMMPNIVPKGIP